VLTPEERALITDMKDHLIELYVERDEAAKIGDGDRVRELQSEIEHVAAECRDISHSETQGSA